MSKTVDANDFKQALLRFPCSEWVYNGVCAVIDDMPDADGTPEVLYMAMIPLNPRAKKNNQQIVYAKNRPVIVQSNIYKQYEKDCGWFLKPPVRPIDRPVNIQCVFYRDSARKCDLTNLLEAIDDILVKYKIIKDDNFNILAAHDGSRVYVDRYNPRTEIIITSYGGQK